MGTGWKRSSASISLPTTAIRFYTPVLQPTSKRESINTERSCCQVLPTDITCTSSSIMRRDPTLPAPSRGRNRSKQVRAERRSILLTDSIPNGAIYMKSFDGSRLLRSCAPRNDNAGVSLRAQRSNLVPSAEHADLLALDQLEVDLGAEPRFGRGVDEAIAA